jgi:hypothetical protein
LFNNFQNITECFNQQRKAFEQQDGLKAKQTFKLEKSGSLLTKRRLTETKIEINGALSKIT